MNTKMITPAQHALIDYTLVAGLLVLPSLLDMQQKVRQIYSVEAAVLLPYVALTRQPLAVKGLIPFQTHGRIDRFNVLQFALQSLLPPFRKNRKELIFNLAFTAIAGLTVMLTDWESNHGH